jgi:phenylpyruvate tautomerase PptA (4-oxalocrotonate tautomerase family)
MQDGDRKMLGAVAPSWMMVVVGEIERGQWAAGAPSSDAKPP